MVNRDLVNYLTEGMRRGFPSTLLKERLVEAGFSKIDIEEAEAYLRSKMFPTGPQISPPRPQPRSPMMRPYSPRPIQQPPTQNVPQKPADNKTDALQKSLSPADSPPSEEKKTVPPPAKTVSEQKTSDNSQKKEEPQKVDTENKKVDEKKEDIPAPILPAPGSNDGASQVSVPGVLHLGFFQKIGKAFSHPYELFERTKLEGIGPAIIQWFVLSLIPIIFLTAIIAIIGAAFLAVFSPVLGSGASSLIGGGVAIVTLISFVFLLLGYYIFGTAILFIHTALIHMFMKLYGGEGRFANSFRAFVYGSIPLLLVGSVGYLVMIIPIVGILMAGPIILAAGIWSFILSIIGLSENYKASKARAFFALLSVFLVYVLFILVILLLVVMVVGDVSLGGPVLNSTAGTSNFVN